MKVKLTNERLVGDIAVFAQLKDKVLPIKASYAIAKNIAHINSILKIYDEQRNKLLEKYAEKDDKGKVKVEKGQVTIKKDSIEQWNKDLQELMGIENEVEIHTFPLSVLDDCKLSPAEFMAIDYMIEEK